MSTLQTIPRHRESIRTALLALTAVIAIAIALLILPTGHRTTRPPTASIARPAPPAAHTIQASGLGNCLVNPYNQAVACYRAAQASIAP